MSDDEIRQEFARRDAEIAELRRRVNAFAQATIAGEAGGGRVVESNDNVTIHIDSLTPAAVRIP